MTADLLAQGTLPRAWARRWALEPDHPTVFTEGSGWWTARDLDIASRRAAATLRSMGVKPGDRVVMSAEASKALVAAHVGVLRLGAVVVPMNTAYREREVGHVVGDSEPTAAVVDDAERASWIIAATTGVEVTTPEMMAMPGAGQGAGYDLDEIDAGLLDAAEAGDPAIIGYTSGTTGKPKGAVLSHANLLASLEGLRRAWRWEPTDRLVLSLPLFHLHGLNVGVNGTLLAGGSMVLMARFDADAMLRAIGESGCTLLFGVPTMWSRLVRSPLAGELAKLRLCVSGSAPLPTELFEQIREVAGQAPLERYGMTETSMLISNPYEGERRAGTVGTPLPGVELRLEPLATGEPDETSDPDPTGGDGGDEGEVDAGDDDGTGEVLVRGPNVFSGYWRNPEATRASFDAEGWFHTGDVGRFDSHGYLELVGRSKELIITGGLNVYPREVEEVLARHPGVAEVAVAGLPSPEWGEAVTAFVVPSAEPGEPGRLEGVEGLQALEGELSTLAGAELAPYKRPKEIRFVTSLPRNALGKVMRHELAS